MSAPAARLAAFFLAPAEAPSVSSEPPAAAATPRPAGSRGGAGPRSRRGARTAVRPTIGATAVLGGAGAAALAVDLATAIAHRGRRRCAATLVWGAPPPAPPRGQPTRAVGALGAELAAIAGVVVSTGGAGVVVGLPEDPLAALVAHAAVCAAAGADAAVVVALCGPRPAAWDGLLAEQGLLVGTVADDAPPSLLPLAEAGLRRAAPKGRTLTVAAPGGGLPRPLRHRAAIRQILGGADG